MPDASTKLSSPPAPSLADTSGAANKGTRLQPIRRADMRRRCAYSRLRRLLSLATLFATLAPFGCRRASQRYLVHENAEGGRGSSHCGAGEGGLAGAAGSTGTGGTGASAGSDAHPDAGLDAAADVDADAPEDSGDGGDGGDSNNDAGDADSGDASVEQPDPFDVVVCRTSPSKASPTDAACRITPGTSPSSKALLLQGTLLAPNTLWQGGQVALDENGVIRCVGCDCRAAVPSASLIECPRGVVSPGFINPHDHITYATRGPLTLADGVRYDHRHDWRLGVRGYPKLEFTGGASHEQILAHELRQLLAGTTAIAGGGGEPGLLRNLDAQGLAGAAAFPEIDSDTFPLDDASGLFRTSTCDYGANATSKAHVAQLGAYLPHFAEGVDAAAANELSCALSAPLDLVGSNTAVVHAVATSAQRAAALRRAGAWVIWSPRSNVSLYGNTAPVTLLSHAGVGLALGTDWILSGSMHLERELACAQELNQRNFGGYFSDFRLWQMVTTNAALALGVETLIGRLMPGNLGDITIFDASDGPPAFAGEPRRSPGSAVLDAPHHLAINSDAQHVALVLRAGRALFGDAALVEGVAGAPCESLDVCGVPKQACVATDSGVTLSTLLDVAQSSYALFSCGLPANEPSCLPSRNDLYTGSPSATDADGDGILDTADACPSIFAPQRPMDATQNPDADSDGLGDVCDACPLDSGNGCSEPNVDDLDADGVRNGEDNCPRDANTDQADRDADGHGDSCDGCVSPNPGFAACPVPLVALRDPNHPEHPAEGTQVRVLDVWVSALRPNSGNSRGFYAQQAGVDAFGGIFVYTGKRAPEVVIGDRVALTGRYAEYNGLSEVEATAVEIAERGATSPIVARAVPDPASLATGGNLVEPLESMLVEVSGVRVEDANPDGTADYDEFAISGGLRIDDLLFPELDNNYLVGTSWLMLRGVMSYAFDNAKLLPRSASDLVVAPVARRTSSVCIAQ